MKLQSQLRGMTLVELCAACSLLAVAIPLTVAALGAVAQQRRGLELRQRAIETADNLLERMTSERWEDLSSDRLAEVKELAQTDSGLPDAELKIALVEQSGPPVSKRIEVELSWRPGAARVRQQVQLSGWVFREATR